jgi:plastocyanin
MLGIGPMRLGRYVATFVVAAGIGMLLTGGPASGQTPVATVVATATDEFRTPDGDLAKEVQIPVGGTVAFTNTSGVQHNVDFDEGNVPDSCTQTSGPTSGDVPPLPTVPTGDAWTGTCRFDSAGRYAFACDLHPNMQGSIVVGSDGSLPPPPAPVPPPAAGPPPPPGAPTPAPPAPASAPAASKLTLAALQRGSVVHGSLTVRSAGARLLVRALARRRAVFVSKSAKQVEVGRQLRRSVGPGRVSFTVALTAPAREALRRSGRLAISVRLTLTPASGARYTATRAVTLRVT